MKITCLFYTLLLSLIPLSAQTVVTNLDDEDDGLTSLDGKNITLTEGELVIVKNLIIDASALPNGFTIDGGGNGDFINDSATNNETRCFFINDRNPTFNTFKTITPFAST